MPSTTGTRTLLTLAPRFCVPWMASFERILRSFYGSCRSSSNGWLALLPDWDERWPTSSSSLREMLRLIGFYVKKLERLASERSLALVVAHCRMARHIPDRCILVADETHIHEEAMIRPRGRSLVGQRLEALAPDPRPRQHFSSFVAISHNTGILTRTVNEVLPAQCDDD